MLVDSGDTFQGGIESNLSEGALVVDAYNAMGYTAGAVGNHDFDFGSIDSPAARQLPGDLRGALKARAAQARYPFLAANLIDTTTGRPVEWPGSNPLVFEHGRSVGTTLIAWPYCSADADATTVATIVGRRRVTVARVSTPASCGLGAPEGKKGRCDHQGGGNCSYPHLITPFGYSRISTNASCSAARHSGETRKRSRDPP